MGNVKIYDKLVRDRIPEIIENNGEYCKTATISEDRIEDILMFKLTEEMMEFQSERNIEEFVDVVEVLMAIAKAKGYDWKDIEAARQKKLEERGSFDKRVLLVATSDEPFEA